MSDLVTQQTELNGTITFANDVIATIAAIAACDIIAEMRSEEHTSELQSR